MGDRIVNNRPVVGRVVSWEELEAEETETEDNTPYYFIGNDELDPNADFEEVAKVPMSSDGKPINFIPE